MTPDKIREVIQGYRHFCLEHLHNRPCYIPVSLLGDVDDPYSKLAAMCDSILEHLDNGKVEKAHRWLGFIQGVFWADRRFTLEQLKDHNRSE